MNKESIKESEEKLDSGPEKQSYKEREAAKYLNMSPSYLRKARIGLFDHHPTPPPKFIRVGTRGIRYLKEDLDAWLKGQPRGETLATLHRVCPRGK